MLPWQSHSSAHTGLVGRRAPGLVRSTHTEQRPPILSSLAEAEPLPPGRTEVAYAAALTSRFCPGGAGGSQLENAPTLTLTLTLTLTRWWVAS